MTSSRLTTTSPQATPDRRSVLAGAGLFAGVSVAAPALAGVDDHRLQAWEAERARLWGASMASDDPTRRAGLRRQADRLEDLIRSAPCDTTLAARLKLEAVARDVEYGERVSVPVETADLIAQAVAFLGGVA